MDKELFEQIKSDWDYAIESGNKLDAEDVEWLISTVEEQQKEIDQLKGLSGSQSKSWYGSIVSQNIEMKKENARLREALQEIAEETGTPYSKIARQALDSKP